MSRVVHLSLDEGVVVIRCHSEDIGIEAIERLSAGGVRLVCVSNEGAALIRQKLEDYVVQAAPTARKPRPRQVGKTI
jgi:predicted HAD superfamily phosphohydrolase YqeG